MRQLGQRHWLAGEINDLSLSIDRGISYALAMAIGHPRSRIALSGDSVQVALCDVEEWKALRAAGKPTPTEYLWRTFDYRDPSIIWPIAKHYGCWPKEDRTYRRWYCMSRHVDDIVSVCDHSPEEVVAQHVVTVAELLKGGVWRL